MRFFNHNKNREMSVDEHIDFQRSQGEGDETTVADTCEDEEPGTGHREKGMTNYNTSSILHDDVTHKQHKHKNFIKQLFHQKSKDSEFIRRGLWSVIDAVDGKTDDTPLSDGETTDDTNSTNSCGEENRNYHHLHHPFLAKKRHSRKFEIPVILINGVEMTDRSFDEDIADDLVVGKNKIEDMFDRLDSKCSVSGEGIFGGLENEPNIFYAETKNDFDKSKLQVSIKGPKQKPIRTESVLVDDKRCQFTYWPRRTGYYTLYITWEGKHVVGSPFSITIN